ncbi:hypothetical protein CALCODRAFT_145879 [Calocera cornea HHB12733]|uniref:Uncharacterized protein n=1 Tax=Calocera cornea HHB12733 TaxID=1353952 RepID=A0A165CRU3_9BASI|nr:hypothetical protein CALCODRAFT_145879 [Calocera cornea HHB12733]
MIRDLLGCALGVATRSPSAFVPSMPCPRILHWLGAHIWTGIGPDPPWKAHLRNHLSRGLYSVPEQAAASCHFVLGTTIDDVQIDQMDIHTVSPFTNFDAATSHFVLSCITYTSVGWDGRVERTETPDEAAGRACDKKILVLICQRIACVAGRTRKAVHGTKQLDIS